MPAAAVAARNMALDDIEIAAPPPRDKVAERNFRNAMNILTDVIFPAMEKVGHKMRAGNAANDQGIEAAVLRDEVARLLTDHIMKTTRICSMEAAR